MLYDLAETECDTSKRVCRVCCSHQKAKDVELGGEREDCPQGPEIPRYRKNEHIAICETPDDCISFPPYGRSAKSGKRGNPPCGYWNELFRFPDLPGTLPAAELFGFCLWI
jgi:hypothetical protein